MSHPRLLLVAFTLACCWCIRPVHAGYAYASSTLHLLDFSFTLASEDESVRRSAKSIGSFFPVGNGDPGAGNIDIDLLQNTAYSGPATFTFRYSAGPTEAEAADPPIYSYRNRILDMTLTFSNASENPTDIEITYSGRYSLVTIGEYARAHIEIDASIDTPAGQHVADEEVVNDTVESGDESILLAPLGMEGESITVPLPAATIDEHGITIPSVLDVRIVAFLEAEALIPEPACLPLVLAIPALVRLRRSRCPRRAAMA